MSLESNSPFLPKFLIVLVFFFVVSIFIGVDPASSQKSLLYRDLFGLDFPTENEGWVCGRRGIIAHSQDGGDTWNLQTSTTRYTLASVDFVNSQVGWAVGDGGTILHTVDGGKTWGTQACPVATYLTDVFFCERAHGLDYHWQGHDFAHQRCWKDLGGSIPR